MTKGVSRRGFLAGLGASVLAGPFVRLLLPGAGRARAAVPPARAKRLLVLFSPNGTIPDRWRPTPTTDGGLAFAPGSILEPLAAHRDELLVLGGLDFHNATNHEGGMAAMLTNGGGLQTASSGRSVDQVVAAAIGGGTRFASLELGVQTSAWGGGVQTRMSYSGPGSFVTPDDDPLHVFDRLFGDVLGDDAAKRRARRQSVLDLVNGELVDLHGRLGRAEQLKLEAHLQALRDVERAVLAADAGSCSPAPLDLPGGVTYDNDRFPDLVRAQMRLAVTALSCGLTRVASLQLAHTIAPTVFSWEGLSDGHHTLSHSGDGDADGVADFVTAERWFAEQVAFLIELLRQTPDPDAPDSDRTLLDETLVLWAKEMGDSRLHVCTSVPFVLIGPAGGAVRTGRYLDLGGRSHAHLLVSVCQAFGLPLETFGDPAAGAGALSEIA